MFSANPFKKSQPYTFRTSQHYKGAIPFEQFEQMHPTLPPSGQVQTPPPGAISATPAPATQAPAPHPTNHWVRYGGLAPQAIGQPVIGQRPQPGPQLAHHWVRANHR
jgi:hypothetical protein